jgi:hypothetical protein
MQLVSWNHTPTSSMSQFIVPLKQQRHQSKCNSFPTGIWHVQQTPSQTASFQKDFKHFTVYFSCVYLESIKVNQDVYNIQQSMSFFIMFSNKILRLVRRSNSNHGPVELSIHRLYSLYMMYICKLKKPPGKLRIQPNYNNFKG